MQHLQIQILGWLLGSSTYSTKDFLDLPGRRHLSIIYPVFESCLSVHKKKRTEQNLFIVMPNICYESNSSHVFQKQFSVEKQCSCNIIYTFSYHVALLLMSIYFIYKYSIIINYVFIPKHFYTQQIESYIFDV